MSGFDGAAYDRWLEAPYVEAAQREADYERWCESQDLDPSEDHWDEFDQAMADIADDAEAELAEAMQAELRGEW